MESYTDGSVIFTGHWTDWNENGNTAIYSSSTQANSGILSGYIPPNGITDGLLDLGNKTAGQWGIKFMMYIPSGKEAALNIQSNIPVSSGFHAVGDIFLNKDNNSPGVGYVKYNSGVSSEWSYFNFPHDEWFEVIMNIHINNNWQLIINGNIEIDWEHYGRWIADGHFEYTNALGGLNFWSRNSNCEYWIDDFDFISGFHSSTVSVSDILKDSNIDIYPNPATDILTEQNIKKFETISISNLAKGVYYVNFFNKKENNRMVKKIVIK